MQKGAHDGMAGLRSGVGIASLVCRRSEAGKVGKKGEGVEADGLLCLPVSEPRSVLSSARGKRTVNARQNHAAELS